MKQLRIIYKDRNSSRKMYQTFNITDMSAAKFAEEFEEYDGGMIKVDTYLYNLLTACKFLSKLEEFQGMPDFEVETPDWLPESFKA